LDEDITNPNHDSEGGGEKIELKITPRRRDGSTLNDPLRTSGEEEGVVTGSNLFTSYDSLIESGKNIRNPNDDSEDEEEKPSATNSLKPLEAEKKLRAPNTTTEPKSTNNLKKPPESCCVIS
jgi:hypothetical protein